MDKFSKLKNVVLDLGKKSVNSQGSAKSWSKGDRDWVTEVDIYNEEVLVSIVKELLDEEEKVNWTIEEEIEGAPRGISKNGYTVLIDPIDGTANYKNGGDEYAISVSIEKDTKQIYSIMYMPVQNQLVEISNGEIINATEFDLKAVESNHQLKQFSELNFAFHRNPISEVKQEKIYTEICEKQGLEFNWETSGSNNRPASLVKDLVDLVSGKDDVLINGGTYLWDLGAVRHLLKIFDFKIVLWDGTEFDSYSSEDVDRVLKLVVCKERYLDEVLGIVNKHA